MKHLYARLIYGLTVFVLFAGVPALANPCTEASLAKNLALRPQLSPEDIIRNVTEECYPNLGVEDQVTQTETHSGGSAVTCMQSEVTLGMTQQEAGVVCGN